MVACSRLSQGVSSFALAAAACGGLLAAAVTVAVAGIVALGVALAWGGRASGRLVWELLRTARVWVIGVVGYISVAGAALAFHFASVATVTFLLLLVPLFAALLAPLYGERVRARQLMALGIGLVGVACFAAPSTPFADEWRGIALALLASVTLALNWHQNRSLARQLEAPWAGAAAQTLGPGAIGLTTVAFVGSWPTGTSSWLWLVVAGVGYAGNTGLRLSGLRSIPASSAALLAPISAITSSLLALVVLGQRPDALTLLGAAIIVAGVVVAATGPVPPQR